MAIREIAAKGKEARFHKTDHLRRLSLGLLAAELLPVLHDDVGVQGAEFHHEAPRVRLLARDERAA